MDLGLVSLTYDPNLNKMRLSCSFTQSILLYELETLYKKCQNTTLKRGLIKFVFTKVIND